MHICRQLFATRTPSSRYLFLFLLALLPRILYLTSIPPTATLEPVDAQGYDLLARNLLAGHGFSLQAHPPYLSDGLRTPLYPIFVAAIYTLFGPQPVAVAAIQTLLDSLTTLLVDAIAGRMLGQRAALLAAALYALAPLQWRYSATLLAEIPLAFLITLATWHLLPFLVSRATPPPPWRGTSGGILSALVALCKANLAAFPLILSATIALALREKPRQAALTAAILLLAAGLLISPWLARNWLTFGRPFLSNASLGYVARVTAPATLGVATSHQVPPWGPEWEARYHALVTRAARRHGWRLDAPPATPHEADRRERQIARTAWEVVRAHPIAALQAHLVGFVRSWAPQEQAFWYQHLTGRPWSATGVAPHTYRDAAEILCAGRPLEALQHAFLAPWPKLDTSGRILWYGWGLSRFLMGGLALLGLWHLRHHPALALALAATILYATIPPGPIGYERFQVPITPLLVLLITAGLHQLSPH